MTAETLRRAAALMRERAEAAKARTADHLRPNGGPWVSRPHHARRDCHTVQTEGEMYLGHYVPEAVGPHIASWHPAVALAVADLLDAVTCACTPCSCCGVRVTCDGCEPVEAALNLARLYLGENQSFGPERGAE